MTAPITPDERAAMRETVATLDAAWEADDPTRPLVTEHATLALLAHVAAAVPRLLDALDTAEADFARATDAARLYGRIVEQQGIDIAKITRSEHLVTEDGDADWGAIWDRGFELADRAEKAEAEVARLREEAARPAPVWDEDTVTEAVARAMFPHFFTDDRQPLRVFTETRSDAELREAEREAARHRARQALAVVREHLPVRPDRETIADVLIECGTWCGMADVDHEGGPCPACVERARGDAHAVLALWPGRSEATVKAEALRDAAGILQASYDRDLAYPGSTNEADWLRALADRIAAEGGADRG